MLRSIMIPVFHRTYPSTTPKPTQRTVEKAGISSRYPVRFHPALAHVTMNT